MLRILSDENKIALDAWSNRVRLDMDAPLSRVFVRV